MKDYHLLCSVLSVLLCLALVLGFFPIGSAVRAEAATGYTATGKNLGSEGEQFFAPVDSIAFSSMRAAKISNNPVSFQQTVNERLEGKTITRVNVPVLTLSDHTKDCKTEIHLVSATNPGIIFATYPLTIPANTYSSNTVNEWVGIDLNIVIGEGQMLAFGGTDDTITYGYANTKDTAKPGIADAITERGGCLYHVTTTPDTLDHAVLFDLYYEDENDDPLAGKYISILGASFSTFDGISDGTVYNSTIGSNKQYYPKTFMNRVYDTWWMKTIDALGLRLCVNNSWSGSCVSTKKGETPAACMTRATQLHNDTLNIEPDIIVLIIGGNDALNGYSVGEYTNVNDVYDGTNYIGDCSLFGQAYATMVHKVKARYSQADIYVCSMLNWKAGMEPYNAMIHKIAGEFGVTYVDLYNGTDISPETQGTYLHTDGIHPNEKGFAEVADCMVSLLRERYSNSQEGNIPGDLNGDGQVSTDDVVSLLLYISMPDTFLLPEGVNADFTGDGASTTDDAVKLLLHISMPDMFPLI